MNVTLTFPRMAVPDKATSYTCLSFDLPTDGDYHMIAFEPVVDNEEVLHHIALYGCNDKGKDLITRVIQKVIQVRQYDDTKKIHSPNDCFT